jgi:hypothetical protein
MPIAKQAVLRGAPLWCGCISLEWQHVLRQKAGRYHPRLSPTFAAAPRLPDRARNKAFEGVVHFRPFLGNRPSRGSGRPLRVGLDQRGYFVRWRPISLPGSGVLVLQRSEAQ